MSTKSKINYQQKLRICCLFRNVIFAVALVSFSTLLHAQNQSYKPIQQTDKYQKISFVPNLQVGISAGPSVFFGDVKQNPFWPVSEDMNEWRLAYGLNFNYNISPVLTIRLQGLYGKLSGTSRADNIWFENVYYELNLNTAINFNNLFGNHRIDRLANVIGVLGFGMMNYNTIVKRLGGDYFVYKRVGYGYGTGINEMQRQEFFMLGIGVDFRITHRLNILLETVSRIPGSDIIDGVISGKYHDTYNYTSVGLSYRFTYLKKVKKTKPTVEEQTSIPAPIIPAPIIPLVITAKNIPYSLPTDLKPTMISPDKQPLQIVPQQELTEKEQEKQESEEELPTKPKIEYRVQIRAEYIKPLSKSWLSSKFNIPISDIKEDKVNNYYVYSTGSFRSYDEAQIRCSELKKQNGIKDAFIVAFKEGKRVFPN